MTRSQVIVMLGLLIVNTGWSPGDGIAGVDDTFATTMPEERSRSQDVRIAGSIEFDPPIVDLTALRVPLRVQMWKTDEDRLRARIDTGLAADTLAPPSIVGTDGRFIIDGLTPGMYRIRIAPIPSGWWLRSAIIRGTDVLDTPLAIDGATPGLLRALLILSNKQPELVGRIVAPDVRTPRVLILFPVDPALWDVLSDTLWHRPSRRVKSAQTDPQGVFRFRVIPPGEYFVAVTAAAEFTSETLTNRDALTRLSEAATKVVIGEGETKEIQIQAKEIR